MVERELECVTSMGQMAAIYADTNETCTESVRCMVLQKKKGWQRLSSFHVTAAFSHRMIPLLAPCLPAKDDSVLQHFIDPLYTVNFICDTSSSMV